MSDSPLPSELARARVCLSWRQWRAAAEAMADLAKQQRKRKGSMIYTTAECVAVVAECSTSTARVALRKLRDAGLLRHHPASGSRPEMFMPATWP